MSAPPHVFEKPTLEAAEHVDFKTGKDLSDSVSPTSTINAATDGTATTTASLGASPAPCDHIDTSSASVGKQTTRLQTIAKDMSELVGETPMVYLNTSSMPDVKAKIALKLECENPMGSVKDRLGMGIIEQAERDGHITPGKSVIIEATSGNTGIALAHVGAMKGYRVIIVMPESMTIERRSLLRILGAEVHLTPASKGMRGSIAWAAKLSKEIPDAYLADQFGSDYNANIHYETTGPEIWSQSRGQVDYFIAGVGTGGTLAGVMRYVSERKPECKFIALEPTESAVLSGEKPAPHKIQGIGAGIVPSAFKPFMTQLSEIIKVPSQAAIDMGRRLPSLSGVFCGISGGAAVHAALEVARRPEAEGKLIVVIVASFGERYLTTDIFEPLRRECAAWPVIDEENFPWEAEEDHPLTPPLSP